MNNRKRYIGWLLGSMLMLLFTACYSYEEAPKDKAVLKIYLFAPDNPIVTRADEGYVDASSDESRINTLDIWVFEHNDLHTLVGYLHLANQTFESNNQKVVTMNITDEYAEKNPRPSVDIYVMANVTNLNCGLTFGRETTSAQLDAAKIGRSGTADFFGLTSLVSTVPSDGLPMSGILLDQNVDDTTAPVYSVAKTKKVKLVRAVSKVRFILSKSNSNPPTVSDLSIKFDDEMVPTNEYLFLSDEYPSATGHVDNTSYEKEDDNKVLVSGIGIGDINDCPDPASYEWGAVANETAQAYEERINAGVTADDLSQVGLFYLRESDKKMTGTITYTLGTGESTTPKSVPFEMAAAGDFTRNHTWIVYGYFLGNGDLVLSQVLRLPWDDDNESDKIHNW